MPQRYAEDMDMAVGVFCTATALAQIAMVALHPELITETYP